MKKENKTKEQNEDKTFGTSDLFGIKEKEAIKIIEEFLELKKKHNTYTGLSEDNFEINQDTPITDDVMGYLTPVKVEELLGRIKALPKEMIDDEPNTTQEQGPARSSG